MRSVRLPRCRVAVLFEAVRAPGTCDSERLVGQFPTDREEPVEAVCDGLVEGVLPVPTAGDSARHEEVDVFRELFAVDGVRREENGCPAALRVVHCFLCIAGHCFRFLSVNDCCLDEVREGDLLDGDGFVVHVCVVGGRLSRFVAAGVRLVETVMIVRVCGGRRGWRHE